MSSPKTNLGAPSGKDKGQSQQQKSKTPDPSVEADESSCSTNNSTPPQPESNPLLEIIEHLIVELDQPNPGPYVDELTRRTAI